MLRLCCWVVCSEDDQPGSLLLSPVRAASCRLCCHQIPGVRYTIVDTNSCCCSLWCPVEAQEAVGKWLLARVATVLCCVCLYVGFGGGGEGEGKWVGQVEVM